MKIAIIGATGFVGSAVLNEALNCRHEVTAIARDINKITISNEKLKTVSADADNSEALAKVLAGHDAVVNAFNAGWTNPNLYNDFIKGSESIQQAVKLSGVKRLLVVGGAGSLEIAPGVQLVDSP
ncbi:MAG TPA: NAD(P)H-binding protein, partial [Mucilaginibacter sp.]|nr:NAD(P)H-binding protein [Mucilaginibacter sp.]